MRQTHGALTPALARRSLWGALDVFEEEGMGRSRTVVAHGRHFGPDASADGRDRARPTGRPAEGFAQRHVGRPSLLSQRRGPGKGGSATVTAGGIFISGWWAAPGAAQGSASLAPTSIVADRMGAKSSSAVAFGRIRGGSRSKHGLQVETEAVGRGAQVNERLTTRCSRRRAATARWCRVGCSPAAAERERWADVVVAGEL